MPTRNVHVTDHLDTFIKQGVLSGRFTDADQAISEALGLLEQREADNQAKLAWLRAAAQEGFDQIERGEGRSFSSAEQLKMFIHKIGQEVAATRRD